MSVLDADAVRELFGAMLRNALTLEGLLQRHALLMPLGMSRELAESLTHLDALTQQHTARLHMLQMADGTDRRQGERRIVADRRRDG